MTHEISRRRLIGGAAALAGTTAVLHSRLVSGPASAAAPAAGRQVPAIYRLTIGTTEVTALCDGYLDIPPAAFPGADPETVRRLTERAFRPAGPMPTAVNAYAVNAGDRLFLIDAGTGSARGANLGHVVPALRAAGLAPENVDAILMTHLHIDHAGGLVDPDGRAIFPRAELLVAEADADFWLDPGLPSRATDGMRPSIQYAVAAMTAYAGMVTRFTPGASLAPGISSVSLSGHTPGHTGFVIGTGEDRLFIWADVIHVAAFQFPLPDLSIAFDVDPAAAVATRRRTFDMVAADRVLVAGMHLPFPGVGHVVREARAFAFVPEPWRANL